jgi:DNA repair protein RecO (recombination protein O)
MIQKTRGIVLKLTDFKESSVIVQVLTESFGLQSYLVHGAKKPKAKLSSQLLRPLQLLDLVVSHKTTGGLQKIVDARPDPLFLDIPYNIHKTSVVFFLNEVLYKVVRHQSLDQPLFQFIYHSIAWLDHVQSMPPHFHLYFLLRLTRFLGFYPEAYTQHKAYFDLKEGRFCSQLPAHSWVLQAPHTEQWAQLLQVQLDELQQLKIPKTDRKLLLDKLMDYYRLHIEGLGEIHAQDILEEVLKSD